MYTRFRAALVARAISLPAQLLVTLVTLVVGTIVALTIVAYRSSLQSLEAQALRSVRLVADTRAARVAQLLESRQQRAQGFLASAESLCAEPRPTGGFGWSEDCTQTMVREFAAGENARGVSLTYRDRLIGLLGTPPPAEALLPGALGWLVPNGGGTPDYAIRARRGETTVAVRWDGAEIQRFFDDRSGLGAGGEVFLMDRHGRFLTPARYAAGAGTPPGASATEARPECRASAGELVDLDYRGVRTVHGYTPVAALGDVCAEAHIGYEEAVAPALALRDDLARRGLVFALLGVLISLVAARWIAAPVRRLAAAAASVQGGHFDVAVPVAGPHEVRELGQAFAGMAIELKKMIEGEQAARREAEAANRSKDRFLAMLSHEMRTPLTAILGWTRMLRAGHLAPDRAARALDAVERSAEAQRRLVEDLLDVSRITAGRLRMVKAPVSLAVVAGAALDAVRPLAEERGVRLLWEPPATDVVVTGDTQRLQQIVWNLAWNAIKFTPDGGTVRTALRTVDGAARLSVSDTGVGIAPDFLPHVFDWYRQDETGQGIPEAGLGLGLALVRQLVELHGGRVHAESAGEGRGATFVVTLPLSDETVRPAARPAAPAVSDNRPLLDGIRVLVVEDDERTLHVVGAILGHAGANVRLAPTPAAASGALQAHGADVLISDINMPGEDGYAFLRRLRETGVRVPAIALTSWTRREDVERAHAAGFQVHLAKPFEPDRLVEAVSVLARVETNRAINSRSPAAATDESAADAPL